NSSACARSVSESDSPSARRAYAAATLRTELLCAATFVIRRSSPMPCSYHENPVRAIEGSEKVPACYTHAGREPYSRSACAESERDCGLAPAIAPSAGQAVRFFAEPARFGPQARRVCAALRRLGTREGSLRGKLVGAGEELGPIDRRRAARLDAEGTRAGGAF